MEFRVFANIGTTFVTLVRQGLNILHVVWLSVVLQTVAFFALMPAFLQTTLDLSASPPADGGEAFSRLSPVLLQGMLFIILAIAFAVMITAGVSKLIVRGEKPVLPFYLSWSADEWRILACWGLMVCIVLGLALALFLFGLFARLVLSGGPLATMLSLIGQIAICLAAIWPFVRLSMFTPATIAERKVGLARSWEATEDKFWGLFGFWLIWIVLIWIIQAATARLVLPPGYFEAFENMDFTREGIREAARKANEAQAQGYDLSDASNVVRILANILISTAYSIVLGVANAVAWKELVTPPEAATA